ncbi:hypothetical protein VTL71DRAFT_5064 [Oculimacula yallundae]|uniref:Uncharacterized protein n=1 Tax=Oculimacula yallundae TaxID=86028 RepID=A0ABR4C1P7_9HELO
MDLADPLHMEGPARGVHNERYMSDTEKIQFLKAGYRIRISSKIDLKGLVATDRIIPDNIGEVYYLTHNLQNTWHWLEKQTPEEPYESGSPAQFCPHVSYNNPNDPGGMDKRHFFQALSMKNAVHGATGTGLPDKVNLGAYPTAKITLDKFCYAHLVATSRKAVQIKFTGWGQLK